MTKEELQRLIDKEGKTAEELRRIGEAYLEGYVLKDTIAAEAWFHKVLETGDNVDSMMAMMLLAKKILGKEVVISEKDYKDMDEELKDMLDLLNIIRTE